MTATDRYTGAKAATSALVFIGVQRDFYAVGAPARIAGTGEAIPAMAELAALFRGYDRPIIHAVRLYRPDGSNVDLVRRHAVELGARVVVPGSPGSLPAPELLPAAVTLDNDALMAGRLQQIGPGEHVMYQPRWGAFYGTVLGTHLRVLGVDTVVFAGCDFPNGPRASMYEASERDFRVVLATDAMSGVSERGAEECRRIGAHVWDLAETRKWLEEQ